MAIAKLFTFSGSGAPWSIFKPSISKLLLLNVKVLGFPSFIVLILKSALLTTTWFNCRSPVNC